MIEPGHSERRDTSGWHRQNEDAGAEGLVTKGLVVLNVLEGEPVEWLYFLSGDPVAPEWQPVFPTVDGLFDFLEDAVDRGAEEIEVAFDPGFGLPTTVRVDYRLAAADEEIAYEVEKLVPIDDGVSPTPGREAARPRAIS